MEEINKRREELKISEEWFSVWMLQIVKKRTDGGFPVSGSKRCIERR